MKIPHSKDWGFVFVLWGVLVSSQLLLGNARYVIPADGSNGMIRKNETHTCFNTACPGVFKKARYIEFPLDHWSYREAEFVLLKDARGVWNATVRLNNEERRLSIGEWPATALQTLSLGATMVYWGGLVTASENEETGRLTEMGSGQIPVGRKDGNYYGKVAYVRGMAVSVVPRQDLYEAPTDTLIPEISDHYGLQQVEKISDHYGLQQVEKISDRGFDDESKMRGFFFGGPKRS